MAETDDVLPLMVSVVKIEPEFENDAVEDAANLEEFEQIFIKEEKDHDYFCTPESAGSELIKETVKNIQLNFFEELPYVKEEPNDSNPEHCSQIGTSHNLLLSSVPILDEESADGDLLSVRKTQQEMLVNEDCQPKQQRLAKFSEYTRPKSRTRRNVLLSKNTLNARRKAQRRASETPEERKTRLDKAKLNAARRRASETPEQRKARLEKINVYNRQRRAYKTKKQQEARREKERLYKAQKRALKQHKAQLEILNLYCAESRSTETLVKHIAVRIDYLEQSGEESSLKLDKEKLNVIKTYSRRHM